MNAAMEALLCEALAECLHRVEQAPPGTGQEEDMERSAARGREMFARDWHYHARVVWLARYVARRLSKDTGTMQVRLRGGIRDGETMEVRDRTTRFAVAMCGEPGEDSNMEDAPWTQEYVVTTELFGASRVAVPAGAAERV